MKHQQYNDDQLFKDLGETIKDMEEYEKEIERLEIKAYKTEKEIKKIILLKKQHKFIKETVTRANDYFLEQVGGPMSLYFFVKELAEQGDEQAKKDLENMKPFIHKYMSEEIFIGN